MEDVVHRLVSDNIRSKSMTNVAIEIQIMKYQIIDIKMDVRISIKCIIVGRYT